jgi:hypothetical protein
VFNVLSSYKPVACIFYITQANGSLNYFTVKSDFKLPKPLKAFKTYNGGFGKHTSSLGLSKIQIVYAL